MTSKEMVSIDYVMNLIQKKCDAVAGLKVQNNLLKKENIKLNDENEALSVRLTSINHENNLLKKEKAKLHEEIERLDMIIRTGDVNG